MRDEGSTEQDSSSGLTPPPWRVVLVRALPDYCLAVRFADGTEGEVDVSRFILGAGAGVFKSLRDPAAFAQVRVDGGAVTWPGELDLAPDAMYREIRAHKRWVLQ